LRKTQARVYVRDAAALISLLTPEIDGRLSLFRRSFVHSFIHSSSSTHPSSSHASIDIKQAHR